MLVILTDNHILTPKQVCQSCVLSDNSGEPRWRSGKLSCGHAIAPALTCQFAKLTNQQPELYQCAMGFCLAKID
jgi:hypothetical protein